MRAQAPQGFHHTVRAALSLGYASDLGVVRRFECTVVPLPRNG
jgi:hypothetical protein